MLKMQETKIKKQLLEHQLITEGEVSTSGCFYLLEQHKNYCTGFVIA